MIQLVVYQAFIVRNMAHQGIRTERDPHSIPGQIVGSDLLVQLQFYFGENMGIMADAVCPGAGSRGTGGIREFRCRFSLISEAVRA